MFRSSKTPSQLRVLRSFPRQRVPGSLRKENLHVLRVCSFKTFPPSNSHRRCILWKKFYKGQRFLERVSCFAILRGA